jgi:hypothetical protein
MILKLSKLSLINGISIQFCLALKYWSICTSIVWVNRVNTSGWC